MRKIVMFTAVCLLFLSCKVRYINSYETYLNISTEESLIFKDSLISISFIPGPRGIVFDIQNHGENNLYLVWDKSYFTEPDGSTSKLLNTDVLKTTKALRDKENFESIIPKGEHFRRFTASSNKIEYFSRLNSTSLINEASRRISTTAIYTDFYMNRPYWQLNSVMDYSSKKDLPSLNKKQAEAVYDFIKKNNQLGLGFTIRDRENEIEYNFKFPIKRAVISKKTNNDLSFIEVYELNNSDGYLPKPLVKDGEKK